jgi:hypothetical protein
LRECVRVNVTEARSQFPQSGYRQIAGSESVPPRC